MQTFSEILGAARRGRPEAVSRLYRTYAGRVFGAVRRRLGPELRRKVDSMDLVQSIFLEVLRDLPRFQDRGEAAFRHWLYIKTENKVRAKLRQYLGRAGTRREENLDSPPCDDRTVSPVSHAADREATARVRDLFDSLDDESRTIVLLRLEQQLSYAEIAQRQGLPSGEAARKRYARSVARLRRLWST